MKTSRLLLSAMTCGCLAGLLGAAPADADVIVGYTFQSTAPQTPDEVVDGVTAGNFLNGPGLAASGQTIYRQFPNASADYVVLATGGNALGADRDTAEEAIAADSYWSFTVTPDDGETISAASLAFDTLWFNADPNATIFVRSSVDDFAADLGSFEVTTNTRTPQSISLPAEFQNVGEALTFRFYIYGSGTSPGFTAGVDNVQLIIPEPGSLGLIGLGVLLAVRRR